MQLPEPKTNHDAYDAAAYYLGQLSSELIPALLVEQLNEMDLGELASRLEDEPTVTVTWDDDMEPTVEWTSK